MWVGFWWGSSRLTDLLPSIDRPSLEVSCKERKTGTRGRSMNWSFLSFAKWEQWTMLPVRVAGMVTLPAPRRKIASAWSASLFLAVRFRAVPFTFQLPGGMLSLNISLKFDAPFCFLGYSHAQGLGFMVRKLQNSVAGLLTQQELPWIGTY